MDYDLLQPALSSLRSMEGDISQLDILRVEREGAKLLHSTSQCKDGINVLANSVVSYIYVDLKKEIGDKKVLESCRELCSKSLLTLVKWLQNDHKMLSGLVSSISQSNAMDDKVEGTIAGNLKFLLECEETGCCKKLGLVIEEEDVGEERYM